MSTFKVDNEQINASAETLKKLLEECEDAYNKEIPESTTDKGLTHTELDELCKNLKTTCYYLGELINNTILFLGKTSEMFKTSDEQSADAITTTSTTPADGSSVTHEGESTTVDAASNFDFTNVSVQKADYGYCNMAAVANLLNRRNYVAGVSSDITYEKIYEINGGIATDASAQWTGKLKTGIMNEYGYSMIYESGNNIHKLDYISQLCKSHPEGILVYAQGKYPHGVVLSYQNNEWYLTDSAGTGYTKYSDSYMAKSNGVDSVEKLLTNAYNIYYVE